jgi:hypothetical protein
MNVSFPSDGVLLHRARRPASGWCGGANFSFHYVLCDKRISPRFAAIIMTERNLAETARYR